MSIRQFNGRYLPDEDRLLFRLNTSAGEEYRFLLTRRVTGLLLTGCRRAAISLEARQGTAATAASVTSFQQEVLCRTADFSVPFAQGAERPLGHDPQLVVNVAGISTSSGDGPRATVKLGLGNGRLVTFRLPPGPLHSMLALLAQLEHRARWGLDAGTTNADPAWSPFSVSSDPSIH